MTTDRCANHNAVADRPRQVSLRGRLGAAIGAVVLVALVAACAPGAGDQAVSGVYRLLNSQRNPALQTLESTVEHALVPAGRAMVHAPQALLVLERDLAGAVEQRIILPNATAVAGDNVLHLRAQTARSARSQEFGFDEISTRFGGLPAPFERLSPAMLVSGTDALGSFVFARETLPGETVCVLVLRRLPPTARPLPRGTVALDMVMRNCVTGSLEQALAPMDPRLIGLAAAPQGTIYTASPFAAPQR
jgi:hypothetical protein